MTNRPEFDPERSAAIRSLLVQTAAASAAAPASGHPRRRTIVLVALAVLAGLLASGTAAVALMGDSLFGAPAPVVTTVAPTPTFTPTPTPTPTSTPTPTPTPTPSALVAPVVRVPATCAELLGQDAAESVVGASVVPATRVLGNNPPSYTGERVGALTCYWSDTGGSVYTGASAEVTLSVVPDVTADAFQMTAEREGTYSPLGVVESEIGPDTYSNCTPSPDYTPNFCGFITLVNGYGVAFSSAYDRQMSPDEMDATRQRFIGIRDRMMTIGGAGPLWQPSAGTVSGASDCDDLLSPPTLDQELGTGFSIFKAEAGEYASSPFSSATQVGSYSCSWLRDDGTTVFAAVLPGGASYFPQAAESDSYFTWEPTTDYPGEAYIGRNGSSPEPRVDILIDDAWVVVSGPEDALPGLVAIVLANVGAE